MKKGIIIMGKQSSGKTTKAKEIASKYLPQEVVWLDGFDYEHDIHRYCTPETKLIVIEEIEYITICVSFFGNLSHKLRISTIGKESFEITPKLVLVKELSYPDNRAETYYKNSFPLYEIINTNNLNPIQK